MLSDSNDDSSDEASGKRIFLTPFLPHSDAEKWGCIEDAYRPESLAKLFQSKANVDRITQFSRVLNYTSKSKSAGPDSLVGLKVLPSFDHLLFVCIDSVRILALDLVGLFCVVLCFFFHFLVNWLFCFRSTLHYFFSILQKN